MDKPKVSIIVPVYNVAKYLNECIQSVLNQSYRDIEVILINDGSTDTSGEICDYWKEVDKRVTVLHKKNQGLSSARNMGLDKMRGEYVVFVDSDDIVHPMMVERALSVLESRNFDCVVYKYKEIREECSVKLFEKLEYDNIEELTQKEVLKTILIGKEFRMLVWNKVYKAELWDGIRFQTGRQPGEDVSVTYKVLDKCESVGYIRDKLYYYRIRRGSLIRSEVSCKNLYIIDAYNEMFQFFENKHPDLLPYVWYAYVVRIFDFFGAVKSYYYNDNEKALELIDELYYRSVKELKCIRKAYGITYKQKLLLMLFGFSRRGFWKVYKMI